MSGSCTCVWHQARIRGRHERANGKVMISFARPTTAVVARRRKGGFRGRVCFGLREVSGRNAMRCAGCRRGARGALIGGCWCNHRGWTSRPQVSGIRYHCTIPRPAGISLDAGHDAQDGGRALARDRQGAAAARACSGSGSGNGREDDLASRRHPQTRALQSPSTAVQRAIHAPSAPPFAATGSLSRHLDLGHSRTAATPDHAVRVA